MSRVVIRPATPADADELLVLGAEYAAADGHDFDAAVAAEGFAPLLADDRYGIVHVAELVDHEGARRLDGYGVVTWGWSIEIGGLDVVLDELYVRTRGCGIGTSLVASLERDCRERGVKRIVLETERPNDAARRLYEQLGFHIDDSIWMAKELE